MLSTQPSALVVSTVPLDDPGPLLAMLPAAGALASIGTVGDSYDCEHPVVAAAAV